MKRLAVYLTLACIWLAAVGAVSIIGLILAFESNNSINNLLLSGKTASAISAKRTAKEVGDLIGIVAAYNKQSNKGNHYLEIAIHDVEINFDKALQKDIILASRKIEKKIHGQIVAAQKSTLDKVTHP